MIARTGIATFHHVMALFTLLNSAHGQEVDGREERHQHDAEDEAGRRDLTGRVVEEAVPVVGRVLHHREALDRRHGDRLHPGEEAEGDPGHAAECEVRESRGSASHRVHRAKLGVHERQDDQRNAGDDPCQDRRRPGGVRGLPRGEQPARADDRGLGCPGGADQPHLPLEADVLRGDVETEESVAMFEPSFRSTYKKLTPASRPHGNDHQRA